MLSQLDLIDNPLQTEYSVVNVTYQREVYVSMPRGKRNHPDHYYVMCDQITELMDEQAGRPLDMTDYRRHFQTVAARHHIPKGSYCAHFSIIKTMVAGKLRRRRPRQASLI